MGCDFKKKVVRKLYTINNMFKFMLYIYNSNFL